MLCLAQRMYGLASHGNKLLVRNSQDNGIVGARLWAGYQVYIVFVLGFLCTDPGVEHINVNTVFTQFTHNVDNTSIAQIGTVLFEGQTHDQHLGALHLYASLGHAFDQMGHDITAPSSEKRRVGKECDRTSRY